MSLIHPQMLTSLAAFYPQRCTFTLRAPGVDAAGVPNGAQGDVAGLISIPCSVNAPPTGIAQERAGADATRTVELHMVALRGHYPAVTTKMECVVEGVSFNVISVDHDAQLATTWVLVERVL